MPMTYSYFIRLYVLNNRFILRYWEFFDLQLSQCRSANVSVFNISTMHSGCDSGMRKNEISSCYDPGVITNIQNGIVISLPFAHFHTNFLPFTFPMQLQALEISFDVRHSHTFLWEFLPLISQAHTGLR